MALSRLTIVVEDAGGTLQFGGSHRIVAGFNPAHLKFSRSANWRSQGAAQRDLPELQFTGAQPRTLDIDLLFDTYDNDQAADAKTSVTTLTDEVLKLTAVEGSKHRPPVCRLSWGKAGVFFQGVLQRLEQDLVLFMEDGTPVRARLHCSFLEWRTNYEDLKAQGLESVDVAKVRVARRGESLAAIAAREYRSGSDWRRIAEANDIDDPLRLTPGVPLLLPADGAPRRPA
jgi:nucleoid-associated protein YgaU